MDGQAGGGDGPAGESRPTDGPPQEGVQTPASSMERGLSREWSEQGENLYGARTLLTTRADRLARRDSERRSKIRSITRRGRVVGDRISRGKAEGLAAGVTLQAVAPYQWSRGGGQSGLVALPPDLRVKVRENRVDADIVFVVDVSDSMGAVRRMKEVKEAALSTLTDSYQKRDQVGLVVSRDEEAAAVLELTHSVELAQRELQALPTDRRTPLIVGLEEARRMPERQRRRVRDSLPLLVLIIDGRANFSRGGDPVEETPWAARWVTEAHVSAVVTDTERRLASLGPAAQAVQVMGTPCYRMEELQARPLAQPVRGHSLAVD